MDSKQLALLCRELADNRKGENIVVLDVRELSSVTDYFVIVSGTSEPHLRAITDEITSKLRDENNVRPRATDGSFQTAWVVLDFFDVIVHVMRTDARARYNLEGLWGDAPQVRPRRTSKAPGAAAVETTADAEVESPAPVKPRAKAKAKAKPRAKKAPAATAEAAPDAE